MKIKKIIAFLFSFVLIFSLAGCSTANLSKGDLLAPPKPSGEMYKIQKALEKAVKSNVKLKYPTSGEYRSAFILKDLDGSGSENYCIALYAVGEEASQNIHINIIKNTEDEWVSLHDTYFASSNVEMIDFHDFTGDGVLEIIVGFNVYSGVDKQVAVF